MFKREEAAAANEAGREKFHDDLGSFHLREAEKYEAKALEAEAKGKTGAAARMRKVVDRNRRLAEKHTG